MTADRRSVHEGYMRRALAAARPAGVGLRVRVGAVSMTCRWAPWFSTLSGTEIAFGRNERELTGDPTAHAEIVAMRGPRACSAPGGWTPARWS